MPIQKLKIILNSNIFLCFIVITTLIVVIYNINNVSSKYNIDDKNIIGIVTDLVKDKDKTIITIKAKENVKVYYYNDTNINLGDKVEVIGKLKEIENSTIFNLFSYKKYMLSKNTYFTMTATKINLVNKNKNPLYEIKKYLISRINKIKKSEYLHTFILGNTNNISDDILNSYRVNGISHLFSVSGMHITLLSTIILYILNKIKKNNINYIFVIIFLLFYMFLTNFTPSVIRATLLFVALTLNKFLKLNISTFKILLIILCLSLINNPYNIYNVGFKFSYLISLFLIFYNSLISKYNGYIKKTIITSSISFLSSIPILINNYFSINIMTIFNNIIFVPLVSILIFPVSLIVLFIPKLSFIYEILINILENLSLIISKFKIEIILCHINIFLVLLYYIVIVFILQSFKKGNYKSLILLIILIFIHSNINYIRNNPYVTFIDVNQGDSSLIHLPYNRANILIDTGGIYNYDISSNIINYLKSEGIKSINFLIITHGDFDHMGSSINLINNFKVDKVIFNCGKYNELEQNLIDNLNKKKIPYYSCISKLDIVDNNLYFLNTGNYDNENDSSNVIYFNYNNYKFLFMGDAGAVKENDILEKYNIKNIDVLKVGHHGSKTSSSKEFINIINPKYSLISVGKNNRYNHPNTEVLENLKNSKIYRTDINGSIMFNIKSKLKIKTKN